MNIITDEVSSSNAKPTVLSVIRERVPQILRDSPRWVTWKTGKIKTDGSGRYGKLPCSVSTGHVVNAHNPGSWGTFDAALEACAKRGHAGIGFDLPNEVEPFCTSADGEALYLVGLDFDECITRQDGKLVLDIKVRRELSELEDPYWEISPSGTGIRAFGLYPKPLPTGNQNHRELYCGGRYLTVTGRGEGEIKELPIALETLHEKWFPPPPKKPPTEHEATNDPQPAPYPFVDNRDDFQAALCAAYPSPEEYEDWLTGCMALAYLHIAHAWPPHETAKIREAWERHATDADRSKNGQLWDAIIESTKKRIQAGEKITTHLSVLKAARNAGWTPKLPAPDPVLSAVQESFALLKLKKVGIVDRQALLTRTQEGLAAPLVMYPREDGALLIRRRVRSEFPGNQSGDIAKQFLTHPSTTCYEGVEFNPQTTSPGYLNLWVGPTISPRQGGWPTIHEFLLVVICAGSEDVFAYVVRFIAHALQKPWEKPGTMIAMIGGEGIGKGTLARLVRRIWSATFLHVHSIKPITGDFNESLERSFWIFLDEALFAGDRAGAEGLKALITEPFIHINPKNQPGRQIASYHRFIAATNAEHFKHIDPDNRRDLMLRVSEHRKGDTGYWDRLAGAIDGAEAEAFAFDLMHMDLSGFNVRKRPNTKELTEQKLQSLPPFPRWWFDCLSRGGINEGTADWPDFVSTQRMKRCFEGATQGIRVYKQVTDRDIKDKVRKVCPSARDEQRMEDNVRRRGFVLPTLGKAREEFETFIGDSLEWE